MTMVSATSASLTVQYLTVPDTIYLWPPLFPFYFRAASLDLTSFKIPIGLRTKTMMILYVCVRASWLSGNLKSLLSSTSGVRLSIRMIQLGCSISLSQRLFKELDRGV